MSSTLLSRADVVLREGTPRVPGNPPVSAVSWRSRLAILVAFGVVYGAVMGSYGEPLAGRPLQMLYSALKVPLLLTATFAIGLPTFFVLNTLFGLRDDFPRVVAALSSTQAGLTVILASLAPVTAFVYASGIGYHPAILLNGLMFATASFGAQVILRRAYRELIARNPLHGLMLRAWLVLYVFVGVQMGWILRPFIGDPRQPTQFFREEGLSNAYMVVIEMIWGVLLRAS
ncbi:hypothetical protein [Planctomyces sp. SH-PL62]|uniref:hypothetical protein n=1 Tax=Planctomyces sp. SH-PL62 TaxID=1636152 RepID=UPI00078DAE25|nr:hypothetical protein [Planctomyces sp. SH-PL62]AMV36905.1 hypothetical protein VT85_05705 [Planctomyces sp. SH-PL62]